MGRPKGSKNKTSKSMEISCATCSEKIIVKPSEIKQRNYCSKECADIGHRGHTPWNKGTVGVCKSWNKGTKGLCKAPKHAFVKGQKPWNYGIKGTHFSPNTEFKKGQNVGEKNHNWTGGKCDELGYLSVRNPEHQSARSNGRVFEHRIVMEKHIDRPLSRNEIIHHINGDKKDNRIENLMIVSRSEHINMHRTPRRRNEQH